MEKTFAHWLDIAEEKLAKSGLPCYVMPGNDDAWVIDKAFREDGRVHNCDRKLVDLGQGYTMISLGYANPTPWDSPREVPEEKLAEMIEEMAAQVPDMSRAIFNLHVPPYASELDTAPLLDAELRPQRMAGQPIMVPVGSQAVRAAIEKYQPLVGLHGHIHESKGAKRLGRTLCLNPGSSYNSGQIDGVIVVLEDDKVKRSQFVVG
jgi:Icc-related predicted phosphoesterase